MNSRHFPSLPKLQLMLCCFFLQASVCKEVCCLLPAIIKTIPVYVTHVAIQQSQTLKSLLSWGTVCLLVTQTRCDRCCEDAGVLVVSMRKTFSFGVFPSFSPEILSQGWCKKGIVKYFFRFYFVFPKAL